MRPLSLLVCAAAATGFAAAQETLTVPSDGSALDLSLGMNRRLAPINPAAETCAEANVPLCAFQVPRDIVFLMDASNSLNREYFYSRNLDYAQLLFCAFGTTTENKAGMITFAGTIKERIPLEKRSTASWFAAINELKKDKALCCTCCTPTADAFDAAAAMFRKEPNTNGALRIAFVVSDGTPYQNSNGPYKWNPRTLNEATYAYTTVPERARVLKKLGGAGSQDGVRLFFVGVPNAELRTPATDYFAGIPDPAKVPAGKGATTQCESRNPPKKFCAVMGPSFPIVSEPVADNLFGSATLDVQMLLDQTLSSLCKLPPTPSPTKRPTSLSPTSLSPTKKPSIKPSNSPSAAPTKIELNHLDLYFLLDRSLSIAYDAPSCKKAPGADTSLPDEKICWDLMLGFAKRLTAAALKLGASGKHIGWQGAQANPRLGLRVTLLGFACSKEQSEPVIIKLGEDLNTQAKFDAAVASALANETPDGGTCPGAAIERIVSDVQFSLDRPFKSAIMFTDGVFYDSPRPQKAAKGLAYYGVAAYALGVAIPLTQYPGGLKPWQIKEQKKDLSAFVNGDAKRVYDLGSEGYSLLDKVIADIAITLPNYFRSQVSKEVRENPYYCAAYSSRGRCEEGSSTGAFCVWSKKTGKCNTKPRCDRPKFACGVNTFLGIPDACCAWNENVGRCFGAVGKPAYC